MEVKKRRRKKGAAAKVDGWGGGDLLPSCPLSSNPQFWLLSSDFASQQRRYWGQYWVDTGGGTGVRQ